MEDMYSERSLVCENILVNSAKWIMWFILMEDFDEMYVVGLELQDKRSLVINISACHIYT